MVGQRRIQGQLHDLNEESLLANDLKETTKNLQ